MQILNNEGGTYAANIVQDASGGPAMAEDFKPIYDAFAQRVAWIDGEVCPGAFQMNTAWYHSVPEKDPVFPAHTHPEDELIGFFGSDPDNPSDLGGQIEFTIGGEPLDPEKTYTLASHNYKLKDCGDGYSMFADNVFLQDSVMIDNQVLINYIVDVLGGTVGEEYADPYGQGRITIING